MKKTNKKIYYDKKTDVLWLNIKSGPEEEYKEIAPGIGVELGRKGELLGIEILNASKVLPKFGLKARNNPNYSAVSHKIKP
ncbi:DUF2283 domain-containing protein [Candidatus Daviesbacteria bacterium]|nr:DUF2283 domain-containing protein [Candidatus Daviesbacteria bacterium]